MAILTDGLGDLYSLCGLGDLGCLVGLGVPAGPSYPVHLYCLGDLADLGGLCDLVGLGGLDGLCGLGELSGQGGLGSVGYLLLPIICCKGDPISNI